jgi:hypothetical protein
MFRFLAGLIKFHPTTPKTKTFFIGVGGVLGGLAAITGRDALSKMAEKVNQ